MSDEGRLDLWDRRGWQHEHWYDNPVRTRRLRDLLQVRWWLACCRARHCGALRGPYLTKDAALRSAELDRLERWRRKGLQ